MSPYHVCWGYDLHVDRSVVDFFYMIEVLWYCMCLLLSEVGFHCVFPIGCTVGLH